MAKGKGFRAMSMDFARGGGKSGAHNKVGQQKAGGTATKASGSGGTFAKGGGTGKVAGFHPVGKSKAGQTGTR